MAWQRMIFKEQRVWVEVDGQGRPVVDAEGRAAMKFKEGGDRVYRPSPRNLTPDPDGARAAEPPFTTGARPSAASHRGHPAASHRGHAPGRRPGGSRGTATSDGDKGAAAGDAPVVHVWTDGACTGNPGPMGIGVVVVDDAGIEHELAEYLGHGTNNIAELTAILRGMELADEVAARRPLRVYSDSSYAIGLLSKNWKAKANRELVETLRNRLEDFPSVEFVKVAGHAGVPLNERCDELATGAIARRR